MQDSTDADLLRQVLDRFGRSLVLYARQWCSYPEDAVQEALLDFLKADNTPSVPAAWLFKVVRRKAMNLARAEQRRSRHQSQAARQQMKWFEENPENSVAGEELQQMIEELPALEREIVVARIWGELTFDEIAELVELSSSAVHRHYTRAISLLRDSIASLAEGMK